MSPHRAFCGELAAMYYRWICSETHAAVLRSSRGTCSQACAVIETHSFGFGDQGGGRRGYYIGIYSWNNLDGLEQGGEESWRELFPTDKINRENHGSAYVPRERLVPSRPCLLTIIAEYRS